MRELVTVAVGEREQKTGVVGRKRGKVTGSVVGRENKRNDGGGGTGKEAKGGCSHTSSSWAPTCLILRMGRCSGKHYRTRTVSKSKTMAREKLPTVLTHLHVYVLYRALFLPAVNMNRKLGKRPRLPS